MISKCSLIFSIILMLLVPQISNAVMDIGLGISSYTSGQKVPSLFLQGNFNNSAIDFTATGYSSQYDYLSGYSSSYYQINKAGQFIGLGLDYGLGGGVYYSERGFRDDKTADIEKETDMGLGPAFFIRLNIGDIFFMRIQSLMGIGHQNNALLIFQDVSNFSVGFKW